MPPSRPRQHRLRLLGVRGWAYLGRVGSGRIVTEWNGEATLLAPDAVGDYGTTRQTDYEGRRQRFLRTPVSFFSSR